MAIELPGEVVSFLKGIGINRPQVNEDRVREFAAHVREFAGNIQNTHQDSTALVQRLEQHAETVGPYAEAFRSRLAGVSFE